MKKLDLSSLTPECAAAVERMYSIYNDGMYIWLAKLWDPEIGGFYYSNSARDYEGFLPDVESTSQALYGIKNSGMLSAYGGDVRAALPEDMCLGIIEFIRGLQDPEDGFFYHPQWGKKIPFTRRGRDLSWSEDTLKMLGGTPKYQTASEKISNGEIQAAQFLQSKEAFDVHLHKRPEYLTKYFNHLMHELNAQHREIKAAGLMDFTFEFIEREQKPDTGAWGDGVNYNAVTAIMKASLIYGAEKRCMKYIDEAVNTCIAVVISDELATRLVDITNPWVAIINVMNMLEAAGEHEIAQAQRKKILENAPAMIDRTREKLLIYSQPDGTFSFLPEYTNPVSQNVPVALKKEREGDVNATLIAYNSFKRILTLIGVADPEIYSDKEWRRFLEIVSEWRPHEKKPHPEGR